MNKLTKVRWGENRQLNCRLECDRQKIKLTSRVKITYYKNVSWVGCQPGVENYHKTKETDKIQVMK
jgi:hypothetical protein